MRPNLRPDISRLWGTLMRSGEIGATPTGGLRRLALTAEDGEARRLFAAWCEEAGLAMRIDAVGNMIAIRPGTDPGAKPVLVGSHLDTQIKAGRFDGPLGVLAALEIVRTLDDHAVRTRRPIAIVNWTNEEGARFEPPMLGASVFTGFREPEAVLGQRDRDGVAFGEALDAIGFRGTDRLSPADFDSLFELHIEQGPKLEEAGIDVGIVTGGFSTRGFLVEVVGEAGHVGPTPMAARRNALVGAAHVTVALDEIGWSRADTDGKSTTARLRIEPNLLGIIPDLVEMTCDLRHPEEAVASAMMAEFEARLPDLEERSRCRIAIRRRWGYGGMRFDEGCIALLRDAVREGGHSAMDILTQAGHDALHIAAYLPTAMIFTPCEGGHSHNESENATPAMIAPGVDVLFRAVLARAEVV